jgi:phosphoribosylformimino-5-aminoimidazole carboxamide ribotide isomerase
MILYPAIDLKDGQCVRLLRGEMSAATVFGDDPAAQALRFAGGLRMAAPGRPERRLCRRARSMPRRSRRSWPAGPCPCQLGGGIRDMATIAMWLDKGLARVILGTVAVENPALVREAARAFPGRSRWASTPARALSRPRAGPTETNVQATDLARSFEDAGVAAIIYTDIDRDGAMQGPNIEATEALARAVSIPVIASGGVSRMEDLLALRDTGVIAGAISGRALYDGAIDLAQALASLR